MTDKSFIVKYWVAHRPGLPGGNRWQTNRFVSKEKALERVEWLLKNFPNSEAKLVEPLVKPNES